MESSFPSLQTVVEARELIKGTQQKFERTYRRLHNLRIMVAESYFQCPTKHLPRGELEVFASRIEFTQAQIKCVRRIKELERDTVLLEKIAIKLSRIIMSKFPVEFNPDAEGPTEYLRLQQYATLERTTKGVEYPLPKGVKPKISSSELAKLQDIEFLERRFAPIIEAHKRIASITTFTRTAEYFEKLMKTKIENEVELALNELEEAHKKYLEEPHKNYVAMMDVVSTMSVDVDHIRHCVILITISVFGIIRFFNPVSVSNYNPGVVAACIAGFAAEIPQTHNRDGEAIAFQAITSGKKYRDLFKQYYLSAMTFLPSNYHLSLGEFGQIDPRLIEIAPQIHALRLKLYEEASVEPNIFRLLELRDAELATSAQR